jgi:drug/metabolite transporter (DMT)-like permease
MHTSCAEPGRQPVTLRGVLGGPLGVGLLLAANGSLIAGIYVAAQAAVRHGTAALGVLAWQLVFAAAVLAVVAVVRGHWPALDTRRLRYAVIAGLLGVSLPNLASYTALAVVPTAVVGVIAALSPVFTYAFALGLGMERPSAARVAGVLAGLGGVLWVLWPGAAMRIDGAALIALIAPALLAAGNVYRSLAWPPGLAPIGAAALVLVGQAILVLPLAAACGVIAVPGMGAAASDLPLWATGAMTAAFYLGAFELQRRAGAVVTGQLGYVITLASLAIGVFLVGEPISAATWGGALLAVAGVLLVLRGGAAGGARS